MPSRLQEGTTTIMDGCPRKLAKTAATQRFPFERVTSRNALVGRSWPPLLPTTSRGIDLERTAEGPRRPGNGVSASRDDATKLNVHPDPNMEVLKGIRHSGAHAGERCHNEACTQSGGGTAQRTNALWRRRGRP